MRLGLTLGIVLVVLLAACGDDSGGQTTAAGAATSTTAADQATTTTEAEATTTTEPPSTTTTLVTTTLAEGAVHFSGEGVYTSEPFSLPGPSTRYIAEVTVEADGACGMVVRIEKGGLLGPQDWYWHLFALTEGTETDTAELPIDISPSDEFRLITEAEEDLDHCIWEVVLRPA